MGKKGIVIIFALISMFLLINGVANFGTVSESEFVYMGVLLLCLLLIALLASKLIAYVAEEKVFVILYCIKKKMMITELVSCGALLLAGLIARIVAASKLESVNSVKEYEHLDVLFPAEKLYDSLEGFFGVFSVGNISGCEILNIVASLVSILLIYFIVRTMYGRSGGLVALAISAFWPSHIYGVSYHSERYVCTLLFLAVIYFFILFRKTKYWWVFSPLCGLCLGVLSYMQTSMYILFVVFVASLFIKGNEGREWSFSENFMKRLPALAVSVVVAVITIIVVNAVMAASLGIDAGKITGINGYEVLSGFNLDSNGNENDADYEYLMSNYQEGKNPKDAQLMAMSAGIQRFMDNKIESFNLILKKAQYIFGGGFDLSDRADMGESKFIFFEDAYYLLVLLGTGILAVELLQHNHKGYINFIIVIGILIVIFGAMFMAESTVQLQFGCIMAICSSAMVSILYRRKLGDETIQTIEEIRRKQMEQQEQKEKWTSNLANRLNMQGTETGEKKEEEDSEYFFDEEEIVDNKQVDEDMEKLLSKLSIDASMLGTASVREKRRKKIEQAKEKQKNKDNGDFDM